MASVVITATAERQIRSLIETHSLPASTDKRIRSLLEPLRQFPLLGSPLGGRWARYRFILGPWRWMLVVYHYDERLDRVEVLTIQDGRSARSPTTSRKPSRPLPSDEIGSNGGEDAPGGLAEADVGEGAPLEDRPRWLARDVFVQRVGSSQADAALSDDLRRLAPDYTDDVPLR